MLFDSSRVVPADPENSVRIFLHSFRCCFIGQFRHYLRLAGFKVWVKFPMHALYNKITFGTNMVAFQRVDFHVNMGPALPRLICRVVYTVLPQSQPAFFDTSYALLYKLFFDHAIGVGAELPKLHFSKSGRR